MSAQWPVQEAVRDKLLADDSLKGILSDRVYDDVPDMPTFPYVVIGDDTSVPWDTKTSTGHELTLTIHVWSRWRGRKETKTIQDHIYKALHRSSLAVTGFATVLIENEFQQTMLDPDGATRHGVQRFRMIVQNAMEV